MSANSTRPGLRIAAWILASTSLWAQSADPAATRRWMGEARSALAAEESQAARYWASRAVNGFLVLDPSTADESATTVLSECAELALRAGATEKARAAHKWVWRYWEEHGDGRPDELARARAQYASILLRLGEHAPARTLLDKVLVHTDTLPADHPDRSRAQVLAVLASRAAGDRTGVRRMLERILEERTRELAEDDPEVLRARSSLAQALFDEGDLESAKHLQVQVLAARERTLPELHPERVRAQELLAATLLELGDPAGARAHWETALAARERTLEAGHPDLLRARQNLARALRELGDLEGARLQAAAVAGARDGEALAGSADRVRALGRLGQTLAQLGRWGEARTLIARALEDVRPDSEHPEVQRAQRWVATLDLLRGDPAGARTGFANSAEVPRETAAGWRAGLERAADLAVAIHADPGGRPDLAAEALQNGIEKVGDALGSEDPARVVARGRSAVLAALQGDGERARALADGAVESARRRFSPTHPDLLALRRVRAWCRVTTAASEAAREPVLSLARDTCRRLERAWRLDPYAAREQVEWESRELAQLFGWLVRVRALEAAFDLDALLRRIGVELPPEHDASEGEVALRIETLLGRARRAERVAREDRVLEPGPFASAHRLVARFESELLQVLASHAAVRAAGEVPREAAAESSSAADTAASLASDEVAVVFRRDGDRTGDPSLWTALVLEPAGSLTAVGLGSDDALRSALEAWLDAAGIERPGRAESEASERERGEELRRLLFDPVLAVAPEAVRLRIVADHGLELVPWTALPLDDGGDARAGDRYQFRRVSQLLPTPGEEPEVAARLFVGVGGVDYGARLRVDREASAAAPTPPIEGVRFAPLTESKLEVRELADVVSAIDETETLLSSAGESTTAWLRTVAPRARALHLATHVFLVDEARPAHTDRTFALPVWVREPGAEWRGSSPGALCGLAVAGANSGVGVGGRVGGIVTAAEIERWNSRRCSLVVLSAFEWKTGAERRALGLSALRRAFHAAGVRHVLLPLWPSDPSAARILLEEFYRRVWARPEEAVEAHLHAAQLRLRELGAPVADWAGWQLSSR